MHEVNDLSHDLFVRPVGLFPRELVEGVWTLCKQSFHFPSTERSSHGSNDHLGQKGLQGGVVADEATETEIHTLEAAGDPLQHWMDELVMRGTPEHVARSVPLVQADQGFIHVEFDHPPALACRLLLQKVGPLPENLGLGRGTRLGPQRTRNDAKTRPGKAGPKSGAEVPLP